MKRRVRSFAASLLLAFLVLCSFADHRHHNPIGDLLADGPSDSGMFLRADRPSADGRPALSEFVLVDDDPCAACFWHDFLAVATIRQSLASAAGSLPYESGFRAPGLLSVAERESAIRGPPI